MRTMEDVVRAGGVQAELGAPVDAGTSERSPGGRPPRSPACVRLACSNSKNCSPAHLDTRVGVQMGSKRGKVTVEFADLEDLERIYRLIVE